MAAVAQPGSGRSQEPGASSRLPMWVQPSDHLDHLPLPSQAALVGSRSEVEYLGLHLVAVCNASLSPGSIFPVGRKPEFRMASLISVFSSLFFSVKMKCSHPHDLPLA